jgi:hypothetical protein
MRRGLRVLSGTTFMLSGCLLLGVVMSGCSSRSSSPSTTPTSRPTSSTTRTTTQPTATTTGPSAANDLAAYFAAAMELDQRLKAAAAAANGSIGTNEITISQSTINAIKAAEPSAAAHEIPAGLPPDVLLPVLTVQSDLESRYYAFRGFVEAEPGVIPRANPTPGYMSAADYLLNCLGSGSEAANSFPADLAAARIAASKAPPLVSVDPSSQAAADLAIWLRLILGENSGCDSCGGFRATALAPISWHPVAPLTPGGSSWDGDIGGLLFAAQYAAGQGWTVQLNAC